MSRMYTTPCGVRLPTDYRERLGFETYCNAHCEPGERPFCFHEPAAQVCIRALVHLYKKTTPGTAAAELAPPPVRSLPGQRVLLFD